MGHDRRDRRESCEIPPLLCASFCVFLSVLYAVRFVSVLQLSGRIATTSLVASFPWAPWSKTPVVPPKPTRTRRSYLLLPSIWSGSIKQKTS